MKVSILFIFFFIDDKLYYDIVKVYNIVELFVYGLWFYIYFDIVLM